MKNVFFKIKKTFYFNLIHLRKKNLKKCFILNHCFFFHSLVFLTVIVSLKSFHSLLAIEIYNFFLSTQNCLLFHQLVTISTNVWIFFSSKYRSWFMHTHNIRICSMVEWQAFYNRMGRSRLILHFKVLFLRF